MYFLCNDIATYISYARQQKPRVTKPQLKIRTRQPTLMSQDNLKKLINCQKRGSHLTVYKINRHIDCSKL